MKKVILMSINPYWLIKILNGEKTIEIRKTMPKCDLPIDVYLYCTKPAYDNEFLYKDASLKRWDLWGPPCFSVNCKIAAKFTLKQIDKIEYLFYEGKTNYSCFNGDTLLENSCLDVWSLIRYLGEKDGYAWHIEDLQIFDEPMNLRDFYKNQENSNGKFIDKRPCILGKECVHQDFDFEENCKICDIDYSGENCPKLRFSKPPQSWCYAYIEEK